MKKDMTMLILSCDKFSDLWDGHVKMLERYWPDRDIETMIVTDIPTKKHFPNIDIIAAGSDGAWTDRLAFALSLVKTEYVFVTLDDYYLIKNVEDQKISEILEMMNTEHVDYVRLYPRPKSAKGEPFSDYQKIYQIDTSKNYSVNLYSGIWRADFLQYSVKVPKTIWQFEVTLHKRAEEYGAKCVVSLRDEFKILDVVRKGKLLHKSALYFKRHPGIYSGTREINTWSYEAKLWIKTMVSRHFPKPLRDKAKAYMRKRGMHFFSDEAE
jgi:hypothetical protein